MKLFLLPIAKTPQIITCQTMNRPWGSIHFISLRFSSPQLRANFNPVKPSLLVSPSSKHGRIPARLSVCLSVRLSENFLFLTPMPLSQS